MNKNFSIRIELLLASPPTKKCQKLLQIFEEIKDELDKNITIDVYYAGMSNEKNPSEGYKKAVRSKRIRIPASFINGEKYSSKSLPNKNKLKNKLKGINTK